MKKIKLITALLVLTVFAAACGNNDSAENDKLQIVATNSILADMIKNVAGEDVELHSIVPVGTDPHHYEVLPEDIEKSTDADVIFYNGLNLETGGNGWFVKLMETAKKEEGKDYFSTSEGVKPMYLTSAGQETEQDPHAWLDISNGITYVENITKVLVEKDPDNKADYEKNSAAYIEKLSALDTKAKKEFKADIWKYELPPNLFDLAVVVGEVGDRSKRIAGVEVTVESSTGETWKGTTTGDGRDF